MDTDPSVNSTAHEEAEPWFRAPTVREHKIAAGLFVGFGVFFIALSWVWIGLWFRWVLIGLGVYSVWHGIRHWVDARRLRALNASGAEEQQKVNP